LQTILRVVSRRPTSVLVSTNPPWTMLCMPLVKRLSGCRYVLLIYDIYPDVLARMGTIRSDGWLARVWRRLSRRAMLEAEGVVTIGHHMAETLGAHLHANDLCNIEVVPNWADTDFIVPRDKADNVFAREHGLVGKFVVVYSGSFGATHDMASVLAAAEMVRDLGDVHFLLIGGGTRQREVENLVREKNLPNLTLLPLQPFATLPWSLSAADCAIVCLDEGYEGISVPSKTYFALSAGAALLAISPEGTELAELVCEESCGFHIPPRSPSLLAERIRALRSDARLLASCKAASRRLAETRFSRTIATRKHFEYLRKCFGWRVTPPSSRTNEGATVCRHKTERRAASGLADRQ